MKNMLYRITTVSVLSVLSASVEAQDCPTPRVVPAYSHNDYVNDRPLHDALALGYRGVEADVFLQNGTLLVAHSRRETDSSRTLERFYLQPLRNLIRRCGRVHADRSPFLLNIESKEEAATPTYNALRELLSSYQDILSTAADRGPNSQPVQVVLVGWHPPLEEIAAESVRVATVQGWISHGGVRLPEGPNELVGLLSLNYGRTLRWRGRGVISEADRKVLSHVSRARQRFPEIPIRAFNVPPDAGVYQALFEAGVDLIGTEDLRRTREILCLKRPGYSRTSRFVR